MLLFVFEMLQKQANFSNIFNHRQEQRSQHDSPPQEEEPKHSGTERKNLLQGADQQSHAWAEGEQDVQGLRASN